MAVWWGREFVAQTFFFFRESKLEADTKTYVIKYKCQIRSQKGFLESVFSALLPRCKSLHINVALDIVFSGWNRRNEDSNARQNVSTNCLIKQDLSRYHLPTQLGRPVTWSQFSEVMFFFGHHSGRMATTLPFSWKIFYAPVDSGWLWPLAQDRFWNWFSRRRYVQQRHLFNHRQQ